MSVTRDGIFYESRGSGFPVLFLHGATLEGEMWAAQVAALSGKYRCITVDRRGHGRSAPLEDGRDLVLDLAGVLEHAGVGQFHLVGHSLGGSDALRLAARDTDRVKRLVLIGAWAPVPAMTWAAPVKVARDQGAEAARRAWLAEPLFGSVDRDPKVAAAFRVMVERHDFRGWTDRIRGPEPAPPGVPELVDRVTASTLIVLGELEPEPFMAVADWLAANVPGAGGRSVAVVPDAGHMCPMEQPTAVNKLLLDWFK